MAVTSLPPAAGAEPSALFSDEARAALTRHPGLPSLGAEQDARDLKTLCAVANHLGEMSFGEDDAPTAADDFRFTIIGNGFPDYFQRVWESPRRAKTAGQLIGGKRRYDTRTLWSKSAREAQERRNRGEEGSALILEHVVPAGQFFSLLKGPLRELPAHQGVERLQRLVVHVVITRSENSFLPQLMSDDDSRVIHRFAAGGHDEVGESELFDSIWRRYSNARITKKSRGVDKDAWVRDFAPYPEGAPHPVPADEPDASTHVGDLGGEG